MKEVINLRGITLLAGYILSLPGIALALTIHEYFKALTSFRLGDSYPRLRGRLSADPKKHFEPIGFLFMLLYGYGWGMPVNTSDTYYKDKKFGALITYTVPSLINLLFAFTFFITLLTVKQLAYTLGYDMPLNSRGFAQSLMIAGGFAYSSGNSLSAGPIVTIITCTIYQIIYMFVKCNLSVAFINLIPIYPLDGSAILEHCLPPEYRYKFGQYKGILFPILILLFIFGFVNAIFDPVIDLLLRSVK